MRDRTIDCRSLRCHPPSERLERAGSRHRKSRFSSFAALREHLERCRAQANVRYLTFHGLARDVFGPDGSLEEAERAVVEHLADDGPLPTRTPPCGSTKSRAGLS
jgi:hypothetical protein